MAFINAGLASGLSRPTADHTSDLAEIVGTHRYVEAGNHIGKIVVTMSHDWAEQGKFHPAAPGRVFGPYERLTTKRPRTSQNPP
ncbi:hypothetical protein [Lentzea sp. NBRC 102530]|uniref:hypothetical protein n=1 Tax=Lentzea sp. NBRC 102530 TaxID=3032201 RepID=UPI0024A21351|nr:hypothetical protein [Lentzea sp. NBRC 102530]GLY47728.1 hypothetical protein Lesp01_13840 [Lentzea sp. NBRC 102530]